MAVVSGCSRAEYRSDLQAHPGWTAHSSARRGLLLAMKLTAPNSAAKHMVKCTGAVSSGCGEWRSKCPGYESGRTIHIFCKFQNMCVREEGTPLSALAPQSRALERSSKFEGYSSKRAEVALQSDIAESMAESGSRKSRHSNFQVSALSRNSNTVRCMSATFALSTHSRLCCEAYQGCSVRHLPFWYSISSSPPVLLQSRPSISRQASILLLGLISAKCTKLSSSLARPSAEIKG